MELIENQTKTKGVPKIFTFMLLSIVVIVLLIFLLVNSSESVPPGTEYYFPEKYIRQSTLDVHQLNDYSELRCDQSPVHKSCVLTSVVYDGEAGQFFLFNEEHQSEKFLLTNKLMVSNWKTHPSQYASWKREKYDESQCDVVVKSRAFVGDHISGNVWHSLHDTILATHATIALDTVEVEGLKFPGVLDNNTQYVWVDGVPAKFALLSEKPSWTIKSIVEKKQKICFRRVIIGTTHLHWTYGPITETMKGLVINFVKDTLKFYEIHDPKPLPKQKPKALVINRRGTRKLTNQIEATKTLEKLGFNASLVALEDYSFKQQIQLIRDTDLLVGVHGAGLVNSFWLRENAYMLQLYPYGLRNVSNKVYSYYPFYKGINMVHLSQIVANYLEWDCPFELSGWSGTDREDLKNPFGYWNANPSRAQHDYMLTPESTVTMDLDDLENLVSGLSFE